MIRRVLLDMDGVLVDFLGGACRLHNKTYEGLPHDPDNQPEQKPWDIEPLFEMTPPELWDPMGREFWANLDPLPHAFEVVDILTKRFGEENICLLTSPVRTDGCIDGKMDWIRKHLPQFKRQFLVGPAKQFAASAQHVLVDDHAKNIEAFKDAGGHVFMFPAPWNHRYNEHALPALKRWVEALDYIGRS